MSNFDTVKYLQDAIPMGPHPEPHAEWIQVRLDVVQAAIRLRNAWELLDPVSPQVKP